MEEGPELIAHRDGYWELAGVHGAEFTNHIKNDDVVFDASQTKSLLKNGRIPTRGKAFAGGNAPKYSPLSSDDSTYGYLFALSKTGVELAKSVVDIQKSIESLNSNLVSNATTKNNMTQTITMTNTFNCPGVTDEDVLRSISTQLEKTFSGLFVNAYQRSMA